MNSYLRMFLDRRVAFIFALGFASGFPWSIIGKIFGYWLSSAGMTRADIAILGGVAMIYALNFLWAPLLDRVRLPWLCRRFGQRRGWILLTQVGIAVGALALALVGLAHGPMMIAVAAAFIVISGATQDVSIDAYRIESIPREEGRKMAAGASAATAGWWTGAGLPGAVAFIIAGRTEEWFLAFGFLAICALGLILITLLVPEPESPREQVQAEDEARVRRLLLATPGGGRTRQIEAWLIVTVFQPFVEFFRRNGLYLALAILVFAFIFKIGEAFLGRMAPVFYQEIGFSPEQVGWVSGVFGWFTMVCFVFLSGMINVRLGIFRGLMISGIVMALANLNYAVIAMIGPNLQMFIFAEVVDNLTTAFSTVAYVSFISYLTSKVYTATQYALLASIGNFGRTSLAMVSGTVVTWLDSWALFFCITTIMVLPSLILLWWIRHRLAERLGDVFAKASPG
jgi:MFS transporter, PAT family, beta-lactamase induction signal transducer AmpG